MIKTKQHSASNSVLNQKDRKGAVELIKAKLPDDHLPYTDKYFSRTKEILVKDNFNPWVRYQVFSRGKPIQVKGVDEAIAIIDKYTRLKEHGGQIWAIPENSLINISDPKEPIMILEGPMQDLVELETMYLGAISGGCSPLIDFGRLNESAKAIIAAAKGKPLMYFGARHFHYTLDALISKICHDAGFSDCSTDVGAKNWGTAGKGTIPHAAVLAYNSTLTVAQKFDQYIDRDVPRVVLIDTFNKEIDDSLSVANSLGVRLAGVRIDTCGESIAQGANDIDLKELEGFPTKYQNGKGVSIAAVWALRHALDNAGKRDVKILVSSGFNAEKIAAFMGADKRYQEKYGNALFDSIGSGSLGAEIRIATSDIVSVLDEHTGLWMPRSKIGRGYTESKRLVPYYQENR